ncbi:MAG: hypothetical protein KGO02_06775 [Alphaproteobacteria bacterium]|nr:hypothetical protein [Alphaproteobacteria bacterium]
MNDMQEAPVAADAPSLIAAACAAVRRAYEVDLPWVDDFEVERDAEMALSQGNRRDLYAARLLCNVLYGSLRRMRRRPDPRGLRTVIVADRGAHRIVVLAQEGSAAVYAAIDGKPQLLCVLARVDAEGLDALIGTTTDVQGRLWVERSESIDSANSPGDQ